VCAGTPEDVKAHPTSHTGQALREYDTALGMQPTAEEGRPLQLVAKARGLRPSRRRTTTSASSTPVSTT
jgi:hypothetical protein